MSGFPPLHDSDPLPPWWQIVLWILFVMFIAIPGCFLMVGLMIAWMAFLARLVMPI